MGFYHRIKSMLPRLALSSGRANSKSDTEKFLANSFCPVPFEQFNTAPDGSVSQCCPAWLPDRIGNLLKTSPAEVWNSDHAQAIRRSILDGSYSYCNHTECPFIVSRSLQTIEQAKENATYRDIIKNKRVKLDDVPTHINFGHDRSCNLSCPSCRVQKINRTTGLEFDISSAIQRRIEESFFTVPSARDFSINVTGTGDPFASNIFRRFLETFDPNKYPHVEINLQTNGVLFTEKQWKRMSNLHGWINAVLISLDAGRRETYNITRRDGNWDLLMENLKFVGNLRKQGGFNFFRLDFVVQDLNFREMEEFTNLAKGFHADQVYFARAAQWGAWTPEEYQQRCVWNPEHPDYDAFIEMICRPVFGESFVDFGNLTELRRAHLEGAA